MDAALHIDAHLTGRSALAWTRAHLVNIITLAIGTGLTLRFWSLFFGIADRRLMTILAAVAVCEIAKRLIVSCRRWQRPQLFCAERRADLMAAIALAAAPWPITVPVNAASPLWMVGGSVAHAAWLAPIAALVVGGVAIRRLVSVSA